MYQEIITGVLLLFCTYTDLKKRCIYRNFAILIAVLAAAGHFVTGDMGIEECLLSLIPGSFCFFVSFLTQEQLGYGDSLVILICGFSLGLARTVDLLMTGLFFAALWAVGIYIRKRVGRKHEIPLMPFMAMAFVIQMTGAFW